MIQRLAVASMVAGVFGAQACSDDGAPANDTGDAAETSSDPSADASAGPGSDPGSGDAPTTAPTGGPGDDGSGEGTGATADSGSDPASDTGPSDTSGDGGGQACVDDHRVVAYLANWSECPSAAQLAQYSHVVIAFAVSYTWTPDGNLCDPGCAISQVEGCNGTALVDLVPQLHDAGVEVLVSLGGAAMGGIWEGTCGEMTKCWDACVDQVDGVVEQLTDIVAENDLDGVDIDYEYCLHDEAHVDFVTDLTLGLRASLDAAFPADHKLLSHVPMDSEVELGDPYYAILQEVASSVDLVMPQYYNGGRSPFTADGLESIHAHYGDLVDGIFGGDASRVVFGYCIEPGCNPVATQPEALDVIEQFDAWYPGNGGVFFWAHPDDGEGWFSEPFRSYYDQNFCGP